MAGLFFEDFEVGKVYSHEVTKTMTLAESIQVTGMCMETEPTYLDEHWSAQHARFNRVEINPLFALSYVMGVQVTELTLGTTLGNLAMTDAAFPRPVFPGDTLRGQTTILSKRESKTRGDRGIVEFLQEGFNQRGELVATIRRKGMMLKRHPAKEQAEK
jgi:acyl dehydratase